MNTAPSPDSTPAVPGRFRKRPVAIDAIHLTKENVHAVARWCGGVAIVEVNPADHGDVYVALDIPTLEGRMRAQVTGGGGDYVIKGVKGEFYPCKKDIFEATYEAASAAPALDSFYDGRDPSW